jgi:hypothetical protein
MTTRNCRTAVATIIAVGMLFSVNVVSSKTIVLPTDTLQLKPSPLPGYAKAQANCVACHSAEYLQYQPPNANRAYWDAMVKRMKAVFKAPINDADMPDIVDYAVKTYGNEQPK